MCSVSSFFQRVFLNPEHTFLSYEVVAFIFVLIVYWILLRVSYSTSRTTPLRVFHIRIGNVGDVRVLELVFCLAIAVGFGVIIWQTLHIGSASAVSRTFGQLSAFALSLSLLPTLHLSHHYLRSIATPLRHHHRHLSLLALTLIAIHAAAELAIWAANSFALQAAHEREIIVGSSLLGVFAIGVLILLRSPRSHWAFAALHSAVGVAIIICAAVHAPSRMVAYLFLVAPVWGVDRLLGVFRRYRRCKKGGEENESSSPTPLNTPLVKKLQLLPGPMVRLVYQLDPQSLPVCMRRTLEECDDVIGKAAVVNVPVLSRFHWVELSVKRWTTVDVYNRQLGQWTRCWEIEHLIDVPRLPSLKRPTDADGSPVDPENDATRVDYQNGSYWPVGLFKVAESLQDFCRFAVNFARRVGLSASELLDRTVRIGFDTPTRRSGGTCQATPSGSPPFSAAFERPPVESELRLRVDGLYLECGGATAAPQLMWRHLLSRRQWVVCVAAENGVAPFVEALQSLLDNRRNLLEDLGLLRMPSDGDASESMKGVNCRRISVHWTVDDESHFSWAEKDLESILEQQKRLQCGKVTRHRSISLRESSKAVPGAKQQPQQQESSLANDDGDVVEPRQPERAEEDCSDKNESTDSNDDVDEDDDDIASYASARDTFVTANDDLASSHFSIDVEHILERAHQQKSADVSFSSSHHEEALEDDEGVSKRCEQRGLKGCLGLAIEGVLCHSTGSRRGGPSETEGVTRNRRGEYGSLGVSSHGGLDTPGRRVSTAGLSYETRTHPNYAEYLERIVERYYTDCFALPTSPSSPLLTPHPASTPFESSSTPLDFSTGNSVTPLVEIDDPFEGSNKRGEKGVAPIVVLVCGGSDVREQIAEICKRHPLLEYEEVAWVSV